MVATAHTAFNAHRLHAAVAHLLMRLLPLSRNASRGAVFAGVVLKKKAYTDRVVERCKAIPFYCSLLLGVDLIITLNGAHFWRVQVGVCR